MMIQLKNRFKARRLAAACLLACLVPAAQAAGLDDYQTTLSDNQLDHLRGRFATGGQVVYFGVTMQTQWQLADGSNVNAGMNLSVANGGHPSVTVNFDSSQGQGNSLSSPGAVHIQGVRQSIQIGGNGNQVTNNVNIDASWQSGNQTHAPATNPAGTPLPATGVLVLAQNGTQTQAAAGPDGMSLDVNAPGQGEVLQQLKSGSGIAQSVLLSGDLNQIRNTFNITAQFQPSAGLNAANLAQMLDTLKGLP